MGARATPGTLKSMNASLRRPVLGTAAVGILGTVIGTIVAGVPGLIAGVMATVVVLLFFGWANWPQKVLANNPALGLNAALGVYLGQILILFIILLVLRNATFFDTKVFASVIAVCAVVLTGLIIGASSAKPAALRRAGIDTRDSATTRRSSNG